MINKSVWFLCMALLLSSGCAPIASFIPIQTPTIQPTTSIPAVPQVVHIPGLEDVEDMPGLWYPAAYPHSPTVITFHGGGSNYHEWEATQLPQWLQNRETEPPLPSDVFVPMPAGRSFNVLVFNIYGDGVIAGKAAIAAVRKYPEVDANRVITIGASAGADSAVAACEADGCIAAIPMSPPGYVDGKLFSKWVDILMGQGKTVFCIGTVGDYGCPPAKGAHYREKIYSYSFHGSAILSPVYQGAVSREILDFLLCVAYDECKAAEAP